MHKNVNTEINTQTAFVITISATTNCLKSYTYITTNCPTVLNFDTGVKSNCICDDIAQLCEMQDSLHRGAATFEGMF